jgi:hypothetical protein
MFARPPLDERFGPQASDRQVLRIVERWPVVVSGDPPGECAGHPIAQEPHLELRDPLMGRRRGPVSPLPTADIEQQQLQGLGTNGVRCDQPMVGIDVQTGVGNMQQGQGIDEVAGHEISVGVPAPSGRALGCGSGGYASSTWLGAYGRALRDRAIEGVLTQRVVR